MALVVIIRPVVLEVSRILALLERTTVARKADSTGRVDRWCVGLGNGLVELEEAYEARNDDGQEAEEFLEGCQAQDER